MKNNVSKVLIGIALMYTAGAAYPEPVEYTFSTNGVSSIDPLLTGLTSVSGSFIYENAAAPIGTGDGFTGYVAMSALSGSADGNSFNDPVGSLGVSNDQFEGFRDFFHFAAQTSEGGNLSGFDFAGMPLTNVRFFWIEGQDGIPDFLDDNSLPSVLPPTIGGLLALDFVDAGGVAHFAFFHLTVVPGQPVDTTSLNFRGPLEIVWEDNGGAIYSGVPIGTEFFVEIDRVTANGFISDGTLVTPFGCCTESFPEVINDQILDDADDVAMINSLAGTSLVVGDIIDSIEFGGQGLTSGGRIIEIVVVYVLDPLAFDDESPDNYPPNPDDVLITLFFISEGDDQGEEIYGAVGVVDEINMVGRFDDVQAGYWAFSFIETLAASGITAGCGGDNYCPEDPVTRAQMAVFLERGMNGSNFTPPAATGNVFLDVGAGDFAASFIEQLFLDGITAGCGNNNYCPNATVTRDQMAVFLLRAKHGAGYSPPPATGIFGDVDLSYWAVHWIEQLAAEGITAGCGGGNYCPEAPVNRDQMAVFLVRTFGL